MNYLAHAYLSFGNPALLAGNIIADFVKGKQIEKYPEELQQGIKLHREIDEFTDFHPIVKDTKKVFEKSAGRYSGSFLDIVYDHFLALDVLREPQEGWLDFSHECYRVMDKYTRILPEDFIRLYSYMKKENWLYNYRTQWLIKESFTRLTYRAKFLADNVDVYSDFEKNYFLLQDSYNEFFPELENAIKNKTV